MVIEHGRPKLAFFTPPQPPQGIESNTITNAKKTDQGFSDPNAAASKPDELPRNPKFEYAPKYAYLDVPAVIGKGERYPTGGWFDGNSYCNPLNNFTRLVFENLSAGFNESYTNIAGSTNVGAGVPITQTSGTTFQFGIGYSQKPILKQLRALFDPHEEAAKPIAVTEQGKLSEDFFWNAFLFNAGTSYGKTLSVKNGGLTPGVTAIETLNSRPSYSVGLTYSLDLERMYIHLAQLLYVSVLQ